MSGTAADLNQLQRNIIAGASHVTGRVWVLVNTIRYAEDMVVKGYLTRTSRTEFRLTDKGFAVKHGNGQDK